MRCIASCRHYLSRQRRRRRRRLTTIPTHRSRPTRGATERYRHCIYYPAIITIRSIQPSGGGDGAEGRIYGPSRLDAHVLLVGLLQVQEEDEELVPHAVVWIKVHDGLYQYCILNLMGWIPRAS